MFGFHELLELIRLHVSIDAENLKVRLAVKFLLNRNGSFLAWDLLKNYIKIQIVKVFPVFFVKRSITEIRKLFPLSDQYS